MLEGKKGGLQAEEHYSRYEAWGQQHHVVGFFAAEGTGALKNESQGRKIMWLY